ncbi:MAG: DUF4412 domain-containing protein [Balneolaceae bacterium]|nr:DUF4412 domain-containing protein [Balneolaceae bacterium]
MKFPKILASMTFVVMLVITQLVHAQFEGQISMTIYNQENGDITEENVVNLYTTQERILIKGEDKINISDGMMEASGILIRSDMRDFVIMMGEKEALRFTKEELEGMFSMINMMSGGEMDKSDSDMNYTYTNEVRTIEGLQATELRVYGKEQKNYLSIWLTNDLDIDWGMLSEPWKNVPGSMSGQVNQMTQEFKSRNFPLLIEVTEKGKTSTIFEVTKVKKSRIAKDMVEMPAGLQLVSLQEMIMKAMISN